jgi:4-hydroxybenzoate polyprenyltransferase
MIHIPVGEKSITIPKKSTPWTTAGLLLIQLRPRQWTKNLLVFAALIFTIDKWNMHYIQASILAFFLFCIISGCVYILNDFVDRHADRQHPEKATRPMASGRLHPGLALSFGAALFTLAFVLASLLNSAFAMLLALYFVMNLSYSLKLKHLVIVDLMIIASGFVLRSVAGGVVIGADFTPWFLMCVFLLSLFLAIGKRRHELLLLENDRSAHRKVLASYSETLLNQMSVIVTTLTIMSYSLYTFMSSSTNYLMWTIPCVIYGMFRYLYLIHVLGKGGKPEELLYGDKGILACLVVFGMAVVVLQQFNVHPD